MLFRLLISFFLFHSLNASIGQYDAIVIYGFGKTGTTSLFDLFGNMTKEKTIPGYPHLLKPGRSPESPLCERQGKAVHTHNPNIVKQLIREGKKILVINPVRNLFDRNLSHFFFKLPTSSDLSFENLQNNYLVYNQNLVNTAAEFYTNFNKALSVDIFRHPFDHSRSCIFIRKPKIHVLVLRFEDIGRWNTIIQSELHLPSLIIPNSNNSKTHWYYNLYRDFTSRYHYSEEQVEHIRTIDFMNHFYTPEEFDSFVRKYS